MKYFSIYCVIILLSFIFEIMADCNYNGRILTVGRHDVTCQRLTCNMDGSISSIGCATYQCAPGKQIGYRQQDDTKVYPNCCGGPICAN